MAIDINPGASQTLKWFTELLQLVSVDSIRVPSDYREQVIETKQLLKQDTSGLVNSILDFSIDASLVNYTLETNDNTLRNVLTKWFSDINANLRGKIPTGIIPLAKEYFRERWKGSSHLVLRVRWDEVDGWMLPVNMWFLDGEDIKITDGDNESVNIIGDEKYGLLVNAKQNKVVPLPDTDTENFYVQKPYDSWSTIKVTPFLVRRGLFRNMKFYDLLASKGEDIVRRAIEYMLLMKKGKESLVKDGNTSFIYGKEDLEAVRDNFSRYLTEKRRSNGNQTYTTQFDTEFEHIIPEYERALKQALYTALERRMLAGLGMVDIVEGTASARREALLNPKPLKREIESGIKDFSQLLNEVLASIVEKNRDKHPKKTAVSAIVRGGPVTAFLNDKEKSIIRTLYDRGLLSKRTTIELIGNVDYDIEVQRRENEKGDNHDQIMYPPVIQNQEQYPTDVDVNGDPIPEDRTGPEADNFNQASVEVECELCEERFNIAGNEDEKVDCPMCGEQIKYDGSHHMRKERRKKKKRKNNPYRASEKDPEFIEEEVEIIYEEAPYKRNSELPKSVKALPSAAQTIWRRTFNNVLSDGNSELKAIRIAWSAVKKIYTKKGNKWVRREHAYVDPLLDKKLRLMDKQEALFDTLLKKDEDGKGQD